MNAPAHHAAHIAAAQHPHVAPSNPDAPSTSTAMPVASPAPRSQPPSGAPSAHAAAQNPDVPRACRIGWNALLLSTGPGYRAAGIHGYIASLLPELAARRGVEIVAFTTDRAARDVLPAPIEVVPAPAWAGRRVGRILYEQFGLARALRRSGAGLYHGAAYAMPRFGLRGLPAVVTVHDLSFFRLPEAFPARQGRYLRMATRTAARRADRLVAVSEFTKSEIVSLLGVEADRIIVVPNGCDPAFRPYPRHEIEAWRAEQGLPQRFILTVGTLQPRKNLGTLVRAYAELRRGWPAEHGRPPDLVVAGGVGWGDADVGGLAQRLGIAPHVHLPGYVPPGDLPLYYAAAAVFAFPSRYEGFGLPAVEAMASGTPVVASDASSLPEVLGGAGLLVPPDDVAGWAAALGSVLTDGGRQAALSGLGIARADSFSWERAAERTADVYRGVLCADIARVGAERAVGHVRA